VMEFHDPGNVYMVVGLTVAMLIGLRQALRNAREAAVPYLLVLIFYPLLSYITHPEIRYRHLMDPEMIILATLGVRFLVLDLMKSFPSLEMWFRRLE